MPLPAFRTKQTSGTTGTGTLTLIAAASAFRSFNAAFGSSAVTVRYVISGATYFEVGIGSYNGGVPGTLTRATVLSSSNSGALVSLPAGTHDVFVWADDGDRWPFESSATTINLALADLGNALFWAGSSAGTVNLPALSTVPHGAGVLIKNAGSALLTLDGSGGETISGKATYLVPPQSSVELIKVSSAWVALSGARGFVQIERRGFVAASTVDLLLPTFYTLFRLTLRQVFVSSSGAGVYARFSSDGGASFLNTSNYISHNFFADQSATGRGFSSTDTGISLGPGQATSNALCGTYDIEPGSASFASRIRGLQVQAVNTTPNWIIGDYSGLWNGASALMNALRLFPSSGTFNGEVMLEGTE
jgi:hypothetical protein